MPPDRQEIRFCKTADGASIAYATSGHGPPLVKAANWLSHLEFDARSPVVGPLLRVLARDHTLVRYDERGCGLSDGDAEPSFDAWVRDLETVVDALGLDRFPLLGICQGAAIAIAYAVRHPDRVERLVLHGGYARGRLKRDPTPGEREEAEAMVRLAELGWGNDNPVFRQYFTEQFIPGGSPEQRHWFNELERISASPAVAARFMRVFHEIDVVDLLPRVSCPTLVLHAARDRRVPFEEGKLIASLVPGARFVPLESVNHLPLEPERDWRRWLEEVLAFLEAPAPLSGTVAGLTPRERELLELIAQGLDNAQIAARLGLREKTVRNHITRIFAKLEVDNRARAIVVSRDAGFGLRRAAAVPAAACGAA